METINFNTQSITLDLSDERSLYLNYMPFIAGCGLFCPTEEKLKLGSKISVDITLPASLGSYQQSGRVIWINPPRKSGRRVPGIGFQFDGEQGLEMREKIEALLGKKLTSPLPTSTI